MQKLHSGDCTGHHLCCALFAGGRDYLIITCTTLLESKLVEAWAESNEVHGAHSESLLQILCCCCHQTRVGPSRRERESVGAVNSIARVIASALVWCGRRAVVSSLLNLKTVMSKICTSRGQPCMVVLLGCKSHVSVRFCVSPCHSLSLSLSFSLLSFFSASSDALLFSFYLVSLSLSISVPPSPSLSLSLCLCVCVSVFVSLLVFLSLSLSSRFSVLERERKEKKKERERERVQRGRGRGGRGRGRFLREGGQRGGREGG